MNRYVPLCKGGYVTRGKRDSKWDFKKLVDRLRSDDIDAKLSRCKNHLEILIPSKDYYDAFNLAYTYVMRNGLIGFTCFIPPFDKDMLDTLQSRPTGPSVINPKQIEISGIKIRPDKTIEDPTK